MAFSTVQRAEIKIKDKFYEALNMTTTSREHGNKNKHQGK